MSIDNVAQLLQVVFWDAFLWIAGGALATLAAFFIIGLAVDAVSGGDRVVEQDQTFKGRG